MPSGLASQADLVHRTMNSIRFVSSGNFAGNAAHPGLARGAAAKYALEAAKSDGSDAQAGRALSQPAAQALVEDLNSALQAVNTGLEFSVDNETDVTVVKVIDRETKETLRQIPSEEALALRHALAKAKGVLIRQSA